MNDSQNTKTQIPGWKDVTITPEIPMSGLVDFLNVLNQRLAIIEDNTLIKTEDGSMITITKHYQNQSEAQLAAEQAKAAAAATAPEDK